ncbi:MAG: hypothetical protein WAN46_21380 [Gammaproteobacteria bacterium]|jgi:hypothetical protein
MAAVLNETGRDHVARPWHHKGMAAYKIPHLTVARLRQDIPAWIAIIDHPPFYGQPRELAFFPQV